MSSVSLLTALYTQNWPVIKQNSGCMRPGHYTRGSMGTDPNYPEISDSESVKTISSGGKHWLTTDRSTTGDSVVSGVSIDIASIAAGPHRLEALYKFTALSWDESEYAILLDVGGLIRLYLDFPSSPGGDGMLRLRAWTAGSLPDIDLETKPVPRATWVDQTVLVALEWDDTLVRVKFNDTVMYEVLGTALYIAEPGANANYLQLGYYGLLGDVTDVVLQTGIPVSAPPLLPLSGWSLTIGGVDKTAIIEKRSVRGDWTRGGNANLSFSTFDLSPEGPGAYRPTLDAEVLLTVDGVVRYRGFVTSVADTPMGGIRRGTRCAVTCSDYSTLLDRVTIQKDYSGNPTAILWSLPAASATDVTVPPGMIPIRLHAPHGWVTGDTVRISDHFSTPPDSSINGDHVITVPPNPTLDYWIAATFFITGTDRTATGGAGTARKTYTLKQLVTDIVATYLTPNYGITLDPTMATGPVLDAVAFNGETVKSALDGLSTATGWIYRVLPTKELQMFLLGVKTAPFNLDGTNTLAPIQWQRTRQEFANRVIVFAGGEQRVVATETVVHDGTGAAVYTMGYPASIDSSDPWPNVLIADGVNVSVVGWGPDQLPSPCWYWDALNGQLHQQAGAVNPAAGAVLTVTYTRQYPVRVVAENATDVLPPPTGRGPWEKVVEVPDVIDKGQAQALADNVLAQNFSTTGPRKLQTGTCAGWAYPGDQLTLTFPDRTVSGPWYVESLGWSFWRKDIIYFDYSFTEGDQTQATWIHEFQELFGGATVGGVTGGGSGGISVSPPPSGGGGGGGGTDLDYLGEYEPTARRVYNDGDIVVADDGVAYICVQQGVTTPPEPWPGVGVRAIPTTKVAAFYLGGSRQFAVESDVWTPVPDYVTFVCTSGFTAKLRVETWTRQSGVNVAVRLFNVTDNVAVGVSDDVMSTAPVPVSFDANFLIDRRYRLEVKAAVAGAGAYAIGYVGN